MGKVFSVSTLKGGVGKSFTAANLGAGLARHGKRVLCLDADSQYSLTVSLGVTDADKQPTTLTTVMQSIINETDINPLAGIIHHADGVDLLPSNRTLAGMEIALAGLIGRETVLRQYIDIVRPLYDYVIIDTAPSFNLLTVNALAAADSIIIPVVPKYLDAKGMELLLKSSARIRRQINSQLDISGILLTMVDRRANFTREIIEVVETAYSGKIRIFGEYVPHSVRAAESTAKGVSIFTHDPNGKVAAAYAALTREVLSDAS